MSRRSKQVLFWLAILMLILAVVLIGPAILAMNARIVQVLR
jgi:hypothetical protein